MERRRGEEEPKSTRSGLAARKFRAIDLSCRACDACGAGAGCWAWIPVRGAFGFAPPNSDHHRSVGNAESRVAPKTYTLPDEKEASEEEVEPLNTKTKNEFANANA